MTGPTGVSTLPGIGGRDGDGGGDPLPWPSLLPGVPVSPHVQPYGVVHCRRASLGCLDDLLRRLYGQWRPLDRTCDHRALFALAYIRITEGLRAAIVARQIRYPQWMEYVITDFSNHYFKAFDDYQRGRPVPYAWKVTFDEAMHGDANGGQDTLLASSAHTQHDLPYIYAEMGMATRAGQSRKPDHDRVNDINYRVFRGLEDYFARYYDPSFRYFEMAPLGSDKTAVLEMVKMWREGAWRNGERLMNATTPAQRQAVERSIDATSSAWADLIRSGDLPGYRQQRDAFCRTARPTSGGPATGGAPRVGATPPLPAPVPSSP
jgi:hypothetical protein